MKKFYCLTIYLIAHSLHFAYQLHAQMDERALWLQENYQKREYRIPMRDGTALYTAVYTPRDASEENRYPILMKRTCYSCRPYGSEDFPSRIGPSSHLEREKYIFVCQDVRGRYMSEGSFDNMRPQLPDDQKSLKKKQAIDESSDTYDTIDWLMKNLPYHNGNVGQWGISYPGFYAAAGVLSRHPALKASSPQAPIADFFFDDFHHHGAYFLSYWLATAVFGYQKDTLETDRWYRFSDPGMPDMYEFYLNMGSLKNADQYYGEDNFFWQQLTEHPNYDEFWQKRNLLPHLDDIEHAVMIVGGWFDAEDLYGPLNIYKTIEKNNPGTYNTIVMGPWSHGDWARDRAHQMVGNIHFGEGISEFYQKEIEMPFFNHFLKEKPQADLPEAYLFDTGKKEWKKFDQWPSPQAKKQKFYLNAAEKLSQAEPPNQQSFSEFVSDPHKPVPYTEDIKMVFTPRKYMTDDQRFAGRRPDVLVFESEVLAEDLTLGGEILANLYVSTSETAADWVVKLIDVYPPDEPNHELTPQHIKLGGYEQMVRSEAIRGRFRESYSEPKPFAPNQVTPIQLPLQDVLHTFKKGHRIMVQIQSTWFPLIDRNPQKYVDNIFEAEDTDFIPATHRVYHSQEYPSYLEVEILGN